MSSENGFWCVWLSPIRPEFDVRGRLLLADAHAHGKGHIRRISSSRAFLLGGHLTRDTVISIAHEVLGDPVIESFEVLRGSAPRPTRYPLPTVEVHYRPGVMDPVAQSTLQVLRRFCDVSFGAGVRVDQVATALRFRVDGVRDLAELEWLAAHVFANDCIQQVFISGFGRSDAAPGGFPGAPQTPFELRHVPLRNMGDQELVAISRRAHLFLSLDEMRAIQAHYAPQGRDPTDLELETFAQTWSEHCVHKTLKSDIIYRGPGFGTDDQVEVRLRNLLKSTIAAATDALNRDWCLSVFEDNAGVIALDDEYGIAFKVETHNHPSAIEPYGGAATGVGGCIRDILGCGLGAKPIASTDVFCLGPPDWPEERVPDGVLHPRRVLNGVMAGVRDYGNRMGIPTVNGAICFDERYLTNPLVFCGCVGLIPRERIAKAPRVGDHIVLVGGRTGRDGIHGATFSSSELTDTHADEFSHAVQIGNPIEEKKVLDAILRARDHESGCLFNAITDCGAAGLSSAVGEMAADLGAEVELAEVPLKYAGLRYDEIWISEAQERMVLAVAPSHLDALLAVFRTEGVETTVIGRFTGDRRLRVRYQGVVVGDLNVDFLHGGLPQQTREAAWSGDGRAPDERIDAIPGDRSVSDTLVALLSDLDVASKEWVVRQYDHEVQGGSVVKPLVGPGEGPSDAAVLRPRLDRDVGVALACGICPQVQSDPYVMAVRAVDEALRNIICVGGDPDRTAVLDNFCWGGVDTPEALGALVRACRGAHDAALAFGLPFISGKDSLNNQFTMSPAEAARVGLPVTVSIPNTLLISAVSVIPDVNRCITMDLKCSGHRLCYVGHDTGDDLDRAAALHRRVAGWVRAGHVVAAHDVSEGGLAVAIAEMCIAGDLGATVVLDPIGGGDIRRTLFGEGPARYILECRPDAPVSGAGVIDVGIVGGEARLSIRHGGSVLADLEVARLREVWRRPLAMVEGE